MRKRKKLKTNFRSAGDEVGFLSETDTVRTGTRSDVPIAARAPLAWWEDEPRPEPEDIYPAHVRERLAALFRANHAETFAMRCADAWPPLPIYHLWGDTWIGLQATRL